MRNAFFYNLLLREDDSKNAQGGRQLPAYNKSYYFTFDRIQYVSF